MLECSCPQVPALEGCGCKYGGGYPAPLGEGPIDTAWHTAAILGSALGALAVWWFNPDLRRDFDAEDRQKRIRRKRKR